MAGFIDPGTRISDDVPTAMLHRPYSDLFRSLTNYKTAILSDASSIERKRCCIQQFELLFQEGIIQTMRYRPLQSEVLSVPSSCGEPGKIKLH